MLVVLGGVTTGCGAGLLGVLGGRVVLQAANSNAINNIPVFFDFIFTLLFAKCPSMLSISTLSRSKAPLKERGLEGQSAHYASTFCRSEKTLRRSVALALHQRSVTLYAH